MNIVTQFAAAETESGGLFGALGIDWQMLIFQIVAFLILVWLMKRFVYPILMKTVDGRQEQIEEGIKAANEAEKKAEDMQAEVTKLLKQARTEAGEVVTTAKEEASAMLEKADARAKERADRTIAEAHEQIEKDVIAARKALHNDTLDLVALATEKVVGKTISSKADEAVIAAAVKEAK
jgi:F-type H+-transporting ATPase subunit b